MLVVAVQRLDVRCLTSFSQCRHLVMVALIAVVPSLLLFFVLPVLCRTRRDMRAVAPLQGLAIGSHYQPTLVSTVIPEIEARPSPVS